MSQGHASGVADHYSCPSSTGQLMVVWNYGANNGAPENSSIPVQHYDPLTDSTGCEGAQVEINCATQSSASSIVASANTTQDYSTYVPYSSSTYGYGSTEYPINYYGYVQQPSYTSYQQVGSGQNSGASYQPNSSFQNTGSYATSSSYSGTYHTGDYQTAAGYQCSGYVDQNNYWHDGSGGSYSLQHSNYPFEHTNSTTTSNTTASSVHYQQAPNHWSANYGAAVSNVIPTPGSGNMVATTVPISTYPSQNLNGGYSYASSQPPPPGTTSWRGNLSSPLLPSPKAPDDMSKFLNTCAVEKTSTVHNYRLNQIPLDLQKPLKSNLPSGENHEGSGNDTYTNVPPSSLQISQASLNPQQPLQAVSVMDARRVSKMQIPTNPRIASSLALGMPKLDKESSTTNAAAKPAYISVQVPKLHNQLSSSDNADANVKALPPSVCDYVRRCLSRCKDDASRTACQLMLSELIAKAKDDGSLWTKNWDLEPPLPLANSSSDATNLNILQNTVSSITKFPNKRSKSRWEPVAEEKLDSKFAPVNLESSKNVSWAERMAGSRILEGMDNGWTSMKFPLVQQQSTLIKSSEKPVKKQRLFGPLSTTENDSNSAEGGKEPELNTHHSSAITLANSPEEKKKREHRSRRFDKSQESHADTEQFKPKGAGVANIYLRRASAMLLAKNFDDRCGRAVEDMDWDALTVKGTCQEIEKRYLRLTSAPDPATVRPEEILEKALSMVQTSQKNYYYKCDQLKSIRQDLTVQRIQNELTVKVYETHARLALEAGDLPEFNQCQSQLKRLYAEGIKGCRMEFSAYNLLCVILHSNNKRDLLSSMNSLSYEAKQDEAVKLALAVRSAVSLGNYVLFFRLYKSAPSLFTCLMDLHVEKMRFEAIKCMSKSYRPTVPVVYISQVLGFSNSAQTDADDGKGTSGQEDCEEWLRAHGAVLAVDSYGELQLDTKASSLTLYMPEPEDAVAHGDANLAVDDFLTRAS